MCDKVCKNSNSPNNNDPPKANENETKESGCSSPCSSKTKTPPDNLWTNLQNEKQFMEALSTFMNESWATVSQIRAHSGLNPAYEFSTSNIAKQTELLSKKLEEKYREITELELQRSKLLNKTESRFERQQKTIGAIGDSFLGQQRIADGHCSLIAPGSTSRRSRKTPCRSQSVRRKLFSKPSPVSDSAFESSLGVAPLSGYGSSRPVASKTQSHSGVAGGGLWGRTFTVNPPSYTTSNVTSDDQYYGPVAESGGFGYEQIGYPLAQSTPLITTPPSGLYSTYEGTSSPQPVVWQPGSTEHGFADLTEDPSGYEFTQLSTVESTLFDSCYCGSVQTTGAQRHPRKGRNDLWNAAGRTY